MANPVFRHGNPARIEYTPAAGDVSMGDVVLLGNTTGLTCAIAERDIANTTLGSLAHGGVWTVTSLENSLNGTKVWWNGTKVSTTSTNNAQFGFIVEGGGAGANTEVGVLHWPYV